MSQGVCRRRQKGAVLVAVSLFAACCLVGHDNVAWTSSKPSSPPSQHVPQPQQQAVQQGRILQGWLASAATQVGCAHSKRPARVSMNFGALEHECHNEQL